MARKLIMMGRVAPTASASPTPGDQKQHSKPPGLKGVVACKVGKYYVTAAGKSRQS